MTDQNAAPTTTCYRHADRSAGVRCQRCDRYICPSCMNTASVGFHCPECVSTGKQTVHTGTSLFFRRPVVTQALIAINVLVFIVSVVMGDGLQGERAADGLLVEGALNGFFVDQAGEWYRIFTSGFLHYGVFHLGMNMYALWILGPQFETSVGRTRFVLLYIACLLTGSFGAMFVSPNALTAGASGAIYGIFGLAVMAQRSLGRSIWETGLGAILAINFLLTFGIRSISVGGHVGGFLGGLIAGWIIYDLPRRVRLPKYASEGALVLLGVIGFVGALVSAGQY